MKYFSNKHDKLDIPINDRVSKLDQADVAVIFGGDGTMLHYIHKSFKAVPSDKSLVFAGINTGHVGFLSNDISPLLLKKYLETPNLYVQRRWGLEVIEDPRAFNVLNEVVFVPKDRGKLFEVEVTIGMEDLVFKGDGLIISSATGSTAYNLSAGGSIVDPCLKTICMTPISPFTMSARPIILGEASVTVSPRSDFELYLDGNKLLPNSETYMVEVAQQPVQLLNVDGFIPAIQNKLGWNNNIKD